MAFVPTSIALTSGQKSTVAASNIAAERIALLIGDIVTNTNATFTEAKSFVDALETEQGSQGTRISSLETLIASSDTALDTLQEIVDFVKLNRTDLDALTTASISGLDAALGVLTSGVSDNAAAIVVNAAAIAALESASITAASLGTDAQWGLV